MANSFYNAFTHGMTPLLMAPRPIWEFEARSAANRAFSRAAQRGENAEVCMEAYDVAWKVVADENA